MGAKRLCFYSTPAGSSIIFCSRDLTQSDWRVTRIASSTCNYHSTTLHSLPCFCIPFCCLIIHLSRGWSRKCYQKTLSACYLSIIYFSRYDLLNVKPPTIITLLLSRNRYRFMANNCRFERHERFPEIGEIGASSTPLNHPVVPLD